MPDEVKEIPVYVTYFLGDEPGEVKIVYTVHEDDIRRIVREEIEAAREGE